MSGWPRQDFHFAPFLDQGPASSWVSFPDLGQSDDPVGPEMTVALAKFTPGSEQPYARAKRDRNRPYPSLGRDAVLIVIGDPDLLFGADGAPKGRKIHTIG
jgi:hypothetical protein